MPRENGLPNAKLNKARCGATCTFTYFLCASNCKRRYMCVSACLCLEQSARTRETAGEGGWGGRRRETCLILFYTVELLVRAHVFFGRITITFNAEYIILLESLWVGSMKKAEYLHRLNASPHRYLIITKRKIVPLSWQKLADSTLHKWSR